MLSELTLADFPSGKIAPWLLSLAPLVAGGARATGADAVETKSAKKLSDSDRKEIDELVGKWRGNASWIGCH